MATQNTEPDKRKEIRDNLLEFSSQDFVQAVLEAPSQPTCVLSFMFGVDFDAADAAERMRSGQPVMDMKKFWFSGGESPFDEMLQPFDALMRSAGAGALEDNVWNRSVDGVMAQLILCDQIPRHLFRGSKEAFSFDQQAQKHVRRLCQNLLNHGENVADPLHGEFYPPYLVFMLAALTHSEHLDDHAPLTPLIDYADEHSPQILHDLFRMARSGAESHTNVVQRFGRYPHRNAAHGRESTPLEAAWLADRENLPGWAKSQMVDDDTD